MPPSRDFDGGLVQRWSYELTDADALAYLRLRRPWARGHVIGFALASFAGGMVVTLYGAGFGSFLLTEALIIAGFFGARDLWRKRAARRMVPVPRAGVFEEWTDCIAATQIDGTEEDYLSPELIGAVVQTTAHIFVHSHSTTLVIPARALTDPTAVATYLRELAAGPYYFDP